ncbi:MAG: UDP-N-acetylmuramate dehydrogenase [Patescibacteria group bacterium]
MAKRGIKLSRFCTMKVGGPADLLVEAETKSELVEALRLAHKFGIKYFVLAGGSNVVFPDKGWQGLVVRYVADRIEILRHSGEPLGRLQNRMNKSIRSWTSQDDGKLVEVEAGAMLGDMVRNLIKQGWGGLNFLANIPGSVGGAIVGNAGCYGKEIKDVLESMELLNVKTGKISTVKPDKLGLVYRHSKLKDHPELVVLSATFKLQKVDKKQALKDIAEEKQLRLNKHPQAPSCGSWFKNPSRTEPAWKFIEVAEMKGATVGGAKISNKHANFLVNYHHAKTADVLKLSKLVQQKVKAKTGVVLAEEVRIIR